MKKIKILHIITRLIVGGAQDVALSIASGLDKDKFDVTFISGPQDFAYEIKDKWGFGITVMPYLVREINPVKDLMALLKLYFFIRGNRFDIVHTHTSKAGVLGRIAAKLAGVPIIFHSPHGSIFHPIYYSSGIRYLLSRIENFVASFTDKIITCSKNEKKDFLEHNIGTEDKYTTIYWGIKQDNFLKSYDSALKRRELGIPQDALLIGNIARFVPEKGHLFCLEAFKMVADRLPKTKLLIAGDGILKQDIEAKINELNLSNNVIMTGFRRDVPEVLAALDISLHTSIWEGTPIAIIEAMLMGKAIIATKVGGIPELIENGITGILVSPNDKKELAEAISMLINDNALSEKMGKAARECAKKKFTFELMIKNIIKLYEELIESKITHRTAKRRPRKKVLFHGHSIMNYYMFEPIYRKIIKESDVEVFFCFSEIEGIGKKSEKLGDRLDIPRNRQLTIGQARFRKWAAVFDADYYTPRFYRKPILVQLFHNIAAKTIYFKNKTGKERLVDHRYFSYMKKYDLLFFPNELTYKKSKELGLWKSDNAGEIVGRCCLDKMVKDNCDSIREILKEKYIPDKYKDKRIILYAPTFGEFNSLSRKGATIISALAKTDAFIIIKPHPLCFKYKIEKTSETLETLLSKTFINKNYLLVDSSPYELMLIADSMISDFSSISFEYTVLRKPIFLFIGNDLKSHVADKDQIDMLCDCCYIINENEAIISDRFDINQTTKQQLKAMELLEKTYFANVGHATDVAFEVLRKRKIIP